MLVFCPSCERQLRVPDEAAGKHVKCPGCQKVFRVGAGPGAENIQAPRAPKPAAPPVDEPELDESYEEPRPRRIRRDEDDGDDIVISASAEAKQVASAAALWFYISAGVTLVVAVINIITGLSQGAFAQGPFGGRHERDAFLAGMICGIVGCGGLFAAVNVLIIVAGMQLKSFGVKGWVVTGIVLAFIQTLFFGGGALLNVVYIFSDTQDAIENWAPLTVVLSGATAVLNCFAAIKGILALNNESVDREFKRRKAPRRRRRREVED